MHFLCCNKYLNVSFFQFKEGKGEGFNSISTQSPCLSDVWSCEYANIPSSPFGPSCPASPPKVSWSSKSHGTLHIEQQWVQPVCEIPKECSYSNIFN